MNPDSSIQGAGLGLRRALLEPLRAEACRLPDFLEVAPENWIGLGGRHGKQLAELTERHTFVCHGLSLSLGGPDPLDMTLLGEVRTFVQRHRIRCYTEHLSYSSAGGHLYDLMPIPFTGDAIRHVSARIRQVQDFLGERIGIENVSYYTAPGAEMTEIDFLNAVLAEADCNLLLDVNNVFVNSVNHGYDPRRFIDALPTARICYLHIAGHFDEAEDLKVDTHGAPVIGPVWDLLNHTYVRHGVAPTLLERDFNFPPLAILLDEVDSIRACQARASSQGQASSQGERAA